MPETGQGNTITETLFQVHVRASFSNYKIPYHKNGTF